jgi:hypothetical protein
MLSESENNQLLENDYAFFQEIAVSDFNIEYTPKLYSTLERLKAGSFHEARTRIVSVNQMYASENMQQKISKSEGANYVKMTTHRNQKLVEDKQIDLEDQNPPPVIPVTAAVRKV